MGLEKRRNVGGDVHSREGAGRKDLGEAIQRCGDWAVTGWIRSLAQH